MPYVVNANKAAIEKDLTDLARALDLADYSPAGVIQWILDLRKEVGIPHTLAEMDMPGDAADTVGAMAVEDPTAGGNPIPFTAAQYSALFLDAHGGRLEF